MATGRHTSADPITEQNTDLASTVSRGAEAWRDGHADLLHEVDTMTQAWIEQRREMIDFMWQSMEDMRNSRRAADIFRIQQEWFGDFLRQIAADLEAWGALTGNMWRRTMLRFPEARQSPEDDAQPTREPVASDSGEPSMLSAAGSKPRGPPRDTPRTEADNDRPRHLVEQSDAIKATTPVSFGQIFDFLKHAYGHRQLTIRYGSYGGTVACSSRAVADDPGAVGDSEWRQPEHDRSF
jgi:hypothetical protein